MNDSVQSKRLSYKIDEYDRMVRAFNAARSLPRLVWVHTVSGAGLINHRFFSEEADGPFPKKPKWGIFHGFFQGGNTECMEPRALVEREDGLVFSLPVDSIEFILDDPSFIAYSKDPK